MTHMSETTWALPDPDRNADLYADVPVKRAMAWIVDVILTFLLTLLVLPFTFFTALFVYPLLWLAVSFIYRTLTISGGSATFGMRLMSIELRNARGERFSPGEATIHTALHLACFSLFIPLVVSAVLMLTTARGQGLPDLAIGSTALNRRR